MRQKPSTSAIFRYAAELRREMLEEYRVLQEAEYAAALTATNGVMLNHRGLAAGACSWDALYGPPTVRRAYSSRELEDHLLASPRTTRTAYEEQWLEGYLQEGAE